MESSEGDSERLPENSDAENNQTVGQRERSDRESQGAANSHVIDAKSAAFQGPFTGINYGTQTITTIIKQEGDSPTSEDDLKQLREDYRIFLEWDEALDRLEDVGLADIGREQFLRCLPDELQSLVTSGEDTERRSRLLMVLRWHPSIQEDFQAELRELGGEELLQRVFSAPRRSPSLDIRSLLSRTERSVHLRSLLRAQRESAVDSLPQPTLNFLRDARCISRPEHRALMDGKVPLSSVLCDKEEKELRLFLCILALRHADVHLSLLRILLDSSPTLAEAANADEKVESLRKRLVESYCRPTASKEVDFRPVDEADDFFFSEFPSFCLRVGKPEVGAECLCRLRYAMTRVRLRLVDGLLEDLRSLMRHFSDCQTLERLRKFEELLQTCLPAAVDRRDPLVILRAGLARPQDSQIFTEASAIATEAQFANKLFFKADEGSSVKPNGTVLALRWIAGLSDIVAVTAASAGKGLSVHGLVRRRELLSAGNVGSSCRLVSVGEKELAVADGPSISLWRLGAGREERPLHQTTLGLGQTVVEMVHGPSTGDVYAVAAKDRISDRLFVYRLSRGREDRLCAVNGQDGAWLRQLALCDADGVLALLWENLRLSLWSTRGNLLLEEAGVAGLAVCEGGRALAMWRSSEVRAPPAAPRPREVARAATESTAKAADGGPGSGLTLGFVSASVAILAVGMSLSAVQGLAAGVVGGLIAGLVAFLFLRGRKESSNKGADDGRGRPAPRAEVPSAPVDDPWTLRVVDVASRASLLSWSAEPVTSAVFSPCGRSLAFVTGRQTLLVASGWGPGCRGVTEQLVETLPDRDCTLLALAGGGRRVLLRAGPTLLAVERPECRVEMVWDWRWTGGDWEGWTGPCVASPSATAAAAAQGGAVTVISS